MVIHSSILAWRIPWTEEPGELLTTGCKESDMTEATEHMCPVSAKYFTNSNSLNPHDNPMK